MSRMESLSVQHTIGTTLIDDETVMVIGTRGQIVETFYQLTISGRDANGRRVFVRTKKYNQMRHTLLKCKWIDKLNSHVSTEKSHPTTA